MRHKTLGRVLTRFPLRLASPALALLTRIEAWCAGPQSSHRDLLRLEDSPAQALVPCLMATHSVRSSPNMALILG